MQSRLEKVAFIVCGLSFYANAFGALPNSVKEITTKSGVCMVYLPGGTFVMGDRSAAKDVIPPHKVTLSPFYMDKFEVTQEMYESLVGSNPSKWGGKKNPVECVRWKQAALYCNARSKKEGLKPCYNENDGQCDFTADGYRLPTEAEWEYACRAGNTGTYSFGENTAIDDYCWYKGNSEKRPHPAGQKKSNAFGIYDLHGNVWEWCNDYYDPNYYQNSPETDPRGPAKMSKRVLRGGSWKNNPSNCTSFYRLGENPSCSDICLGYDNYGFRCVRNGDEGSPKQTTSKTELKNEYICIRVLPREKRVELQYKLQGQWLVAGNIVPVVQEVPIINELRSFSGDGNDLTVYFITKAGEELGLTFKINKDYPLFETRPAKGVKRIAVYAQSSYGITPDLFANDLVFDANDYRSGKISPPNEHCFINLFDNGNAMLMFLWPSLEQRIDVYDENGRSKRIEVYYHGGDSVLIGLLSQRGIWHVEDAKTLDFLEEKKLDWQIPFPARWCINYKRTTGLMETFGSLNKKGNRFVDSDLAVTNHDNHTVWVSARNGFIYPFYVEDSNAYVRLPKFSEHAEIMYQTEGPVVIYPFDRISDTPSNAFVPFDLMRISFEKTSDSNVYEGVHVKVNPKAVYPSTCEVTYKAEELFGEDQEASHKDQIIKEIKAMDMFVLSIRERVEEYQIWSKMMRDFCTQQSREHPEVNDIAKEMTDSLLKIENKYDEIKAAFKSPEEERLFSAQIIKLVDSNDPNKSEKVQLLGRDIRSLGGAQDWMVGYCRQILSEMRQRAGNMIAKTSEGPKREFLQEIRDRIHEFTRFTFFHESGIEGGRR